MDCICGLQNENQEPTGCNKYCKTKIYYKRKMPEQTNNFKHIWKTPLWLALLTILGLLSALLETGVWGVLSWIALSAMPIIIMWYTLIPVSSK